MDNFTRIEQEKILSFNTKIKIRFWGHEYYPKNAEKVPLQHCSDLKNLYCFDRELRVLTWRKLKSIEQLCKVVLSETIKDELTHQEYYNSIYNILNKKPQDRLEAYYNVATDLGEYSGIYFSLSGFLTFGQIKRFCHEYNFSNKFYDQMQEYLKVPKKYSENFLNSLCSFRNNIAHHNGLITLFPHMSRSYKRAHRAHNNDYTPFKKELIQYYCNKKCLKTIRKKEGFFSCFFVIDNFLEYNSYEILSKHKTYRALFDKYEGFIWAINAPQKWETYF